VPLTAGHLGTAGNMAGHLLVRATLAAGSPPSAAVGPARARCRTCARKGPVSGHGGPGHWRPLGRRPGQVWGTAARWRAVAGLRRVPVRYEVHHPGRPAGLPRLRGPGGLIRDSSWRGSRCPAPRPGQHGQAVAPLAWLTARRAPRSARISASA